MEYCRVCGEETDDPGGVCWRCSTQSRPIPKFEEPPKSDSQRKAGYTSRYVPLPADGQPTAERTSTIEVEVEKPLVPPWLLNMCLLAVMFGMLYGLWTMVVEDHYDRWVSKRKLAKVVVYLKDIKLELDYITNADSPFYPENLAGVDAAKGFPGFRTVYYTDDIALDGEPAGLGMILLAVPDEFCNGATAVFLDEGNNVFEYEVKTKDELAELASTAWEDINWDLDAGAENPSRLDGKQISFTRQKPK